MSDLTSKEKDVLKAIAKNLKDAHALFQQTFTGSRQNELNEFHNESGSLGHCLRWGETAVEELINEFDQSNFRPK